MNSKQATLIYWGRYTYKQMLGLVRFFSSWCKCLFSPAPKLSLSCHWGPGNVLWAVLKDVIRSITCIKKGDFAEKTKLWQQPRCSERRSLANPAALGMWLYIIKLFKNLPGPFLFLVCKLQVKCTSGYKLPLYEDAIAGRYTSDTSGKQITTAVSMTQAIRIMP